MARHEEGFFSASDGTKVFWTEDFPAADPKAFITVVHGMGDHIGRYVTPIAALNEAGFAVVGFDYRGHGKSGGKRGHVSHFADYQAEMGAIVARTRDAAQGKKTFLLAHSHGALLAIKYLEQPTNAEGIAGLVLTSPYFDIAFKPPAWKTAPVGILSALAPSLGVDAGLQIEHLSRDTAWQDSSAKDPLYGRKVSPRWFVEHRAAQKDVVAHPERIRLPVLMLTAGDDHIVSTPTARSYFEKLASQDKQYKEHPGMQHEILNELGKEDVYREIVRWISAHL